jgi:Zn-dependent peptidase ImmA (M78 family)
MDFIITTVQNLRSNHSNRSSVALIHSILTEYEIVVDPWPIQTDKFSGCLWKNNEEWTIVLNSQQNPQRRLFTIAHELGHFFLHRHVRERFTCSFNTTSPLSRLEREANQFAAELLMPEDQVADYTRKFPSVARAARFFGVSEEAMQYRIASLQRSIPPRDTKF